MQSRFSIARFSVRTLLVGITLLAVMLAIVFHWDAPARRRHEAIVRITAGFGNSVRYDDAFESNIKRPSPIHKLLGVEFFHDHFHQVSEIHFGTGKDESLALVPLFSRVRSIKVWSGGTEEGLQATFACRDLEELDLHGGPALSDRSLKALSSLKKLRSVNFACGRQATSEGMEQFSQLTSLESLQIHAASCHRNSLQSVSKLQNLRRLTLNFPVADFDPETREWTDNPPEDLSFIGRLSNLQSLWISARAGISPEFVASLRGLPELQQLTIHSTDMTDEVLAELGRLRQIKSLILGCSGGMMSDAGLAELAGLSQLYRLELQPGDEVTDAGLRALGALPKLRALYLMRVSSERITGAGLADLEQLEFLAFEGSGKDEEKFLQLPLPPQLKYAAFENVSNLTNESLRTLSAGPQLEELFFLDCDRITDAGLAHLKSAAGLKVVVFEFCEGPTQAGAAALEQGWPGCKVFHHPYSHGFSKPHEMSFHAFAE